MEERLQKILAQAGFGSRRACEDLIREGRVTVNGRVPELGFKANAAHDKIVVDGQLLQAPEALRYIVLHKPRGVVSSLEPQGDRQTVRDLVPAKERLYPVGRLDMDSEGLILLTNDGELTNRLTHPRYETEKEYRVLVRGEPDPDRLEAWRRGVVVEGKRTAPALVWRQEKAGGNTWLRVVMHEGRKHEIRDIGRTLGLLVQRLIRTRMGTLTLDTLKPGEWRELTAREVRELSAESQAPKHQAPPTRRNDPKPKPARPPRVDERKRRKA